LSKTLAAHLELTAKGLIDLGALVTHRYTLAEVDRAYSDLQHKPPGFIKAVVRP
jgi:threonine dehydrogenase-like Zn-dependent dehydrogenase